ncbi:hypothetical protein K431DRAFT_168473 [Polychaeton citri CBS 116435]|uniref:Uncharacterized protein n=1 Tax=Polychaeton citri CBS 116435 TaxID=1314669 RepID=A0A9P4Q2S0_9PEZI|nr:hypothetical protein K431DRAFT_168473 [Polychaeton citri CBS 116435]
MLRLQPSTLSLTPSDLEASNRRLLLKQRRRLAALASSGPHVQLNPSPARNTASFITTVENNPALQRAALSESEASLHAGYDCFQGGVPVSFTGSPDDEWTIDVPVRTSSIGGYGGRIGGQAHERNSPERAVSLESSMDFESSELTGQLSGSEASRDLQPSTHTLKSPNSSNVDNDIPLLPSGPRSTILRHHKSRSLDDYLGQLGDLRFRNVLSEPPPYAVEDSFSSSLHLANQSKWKGGLRNPVLDPEASLFIPSTLPATIDSESSCSSPTHSRAHRAPAFASSTNEQNGNLVGSINPADLREGSISATQQRGMTYSRRLSKTQPTPSQALPVIDRYPVLRKPVPPLSRRKGVPLQLDLIQTLDRCAQYDESLATSSRAPLEEETKRLPSLGSIASSISGIVLNDDQDAADLVGGSESPLDRLAEGLDRMKMVLDGCDNLFALSTPKAAKPLLHGNPFDQESPQGSDVVHRANDSPRAESDISFRSSRATIAKASHPLDSLTRTHSEYSTPYSGSREISQSPSGPVPNDRTTSPLFPHQQHRSHEAYDSPGPNRSRPTPRTALRHALPISVYADFPTNYELPPATHRATVPSTSTHTGQSPLPPSPVAQIHQYPMNHVRNRPIAVHRRERESENDLEGQYGGHLTAMQEDRARWLARQEAREEGLQETPPGEGRFERFME